MLRWSSLVVIAVGCGGRQATPPPPLAGSGSATTTVATPPPDAAVREPDPPLPPPGPLDHDLDRLAERSVALYGDIVRAFDNAEDCPAATRRLDELTRSYADVIAANAKVLHEGRELQLKIALRRFDDQFQKAAKAIMQSKTIAACFQDAAFGKALDGLVGARP